MLKDKITALYCRLSQEDGLEESNSITNQVIIYKGGILPPKIYYDCGSFVVNRKAVVGKEKTCITAEIQHERGCIIYRIIKACAFDYNKSEAQFFHLSICKSHSEP